jgi:hypothetical protein
VFFKTLLLKLENLIEALAAFLLKIEPEIVKRNRYRHWIPILVAIIFVMLDNFVPSDLRIRLVLTPMEIDTRITLKSFLYSAGKWKHVLFFFLLYVQLKRIWLARETRIVVFMIFVSLLIEFEQAFIAGREARPLDLMANLAGYVLARWYLANRAKRRKLIP